MRLLICSMTCFLLTTLSLAQPDSIYFGSYIDAEGTISYEIDRLEYEMEAYCFAVSHILYKETETDMEIYTETGFGACAAVNGTFGVEMESQSDSIIRLEFGLDSNGDPSMIVHRDGKPDEAFAYVPTFDDPGFEEYQDPPLLEEVFPTVYRRADGAELEFYPDSEPPFFALTVFITATGKCTGSFVEGELVPVDATNQAFTYQTDDCLISLQLKGNQITVKEQNCKNRYSTYCAPWAGVFTLTETGNE